MKLAQIIVILLASIFSVQLFAAEKTLTGVPHYYEFDTENAGGTSWYFCGHTALKIAQIYKGRTKTLGQIHQIFLKNSPNGYGANNYCAVGSGSSWCAKVQDLAWAQYSKNGGYGTVSDSVGTGNNDALNLRGPFSNASDFYSKTKEAINLGHPVIAPSAVRYSSAGHFWVIVGYKDVFLAGTSTIDTTKSVLYVRDVAISTPLNTNYDRIFTASEFFSKSGNTYNPNTQQWEGQKGQLLIIR